MSFFLHFILPFTKDSPIYYDSLFNNYYTLENLIDELEVCTNQYKKFEDILYNFLKSYNIDDETIATILNFSYTDTIDFIIKIIKNEII